MAGPVPDVKLRQPSPPRTPRMMGQQKMTESGVNTFYAKPPPSVFTVHERTAGLGLSAKTSWQLPRPPTLRLSP